MRKRKSEILEAVHETAMDLYQAGVMDRVTMRKFDRLCLPPIRQSRRVTSGITWRKMTTYA
jgi:putative transcriptional regulator